MKKYTAFCRRCNRITLFLGVLFITFAIGLTCIQVICRNTVGFSFTWAEELTRYIIIFAVYLASGSVLYLDMNARVDIFYNLFSDKSRRILSCLFLLLTACFLVVMAYYGYIYTMRNLRIWCASIHIPWAVPFSSLILGAVNMFIQIPAKLYLLWDPQAQRDI